MRNNIAIATTVAGLGLTMALVLLLGGDRMPVARAASFTVDVLYDKNDGSCTPGDCSLREAIIDANGNSQADEITLGPGIHLLSIPGTDEDACATGDLDVTGILTITGQGPDQTIIDASGVITDRVLDIRSGAGTVVLSGVTIVNGNITGLGGGIYNYNADLTLTNVDVVSNAANGSGWSGWGGGLYAREGSMVLDTVRVISNTAGEKGGGVFVHHGDATVHEGQILSNTASTGAGLYVALGEATVSGGEIRGNVASFVGGGIYAVAGATFTQTGATEIAHNEADTGGGVYVYQDATASLTGARIYGNTASGLSGKGGGLIVVDAGATVSRGYVTSNSADVGGGAWNRGMLTLVNTTVSGNSATSDAGGIWNEGTLVLTYTTVAHNNSIANSSGGIGNQSDAYAQNTIVAHNTPYNCWDDGLTSNDNNLDGGHDCGFSGAGDLSDTDPKLGPLAKSLGTMVHALDDDSPAIDAGFCLGGIATDQRGVDRPKGVAGKCDIGAYEFGTARIYLPLVVREG